METTDIHVHVFPYDYYADKPRDTVGLSRTASIINEIRSEATNSILVDNGDFLQGNPMGDYIAYERGMKEGDAHPIITAFNTVGYDAATLGNHEFNYGLDFLEKSLASAEFPVVLANVSKAQGATPRDDKTLIKPYAIIDREIEMGDGTKHSIKIGVIGFAPPQIMNWDRKHLEGNVQARDIVETARAYVPEMKEQGCDLVIALSHSGIGDANHVDGMENASVVLAGVDGIDALVTGHNHLVFPSPTFSDRPGIDVEKGTLMGKPAVMGGFWGSHLGFWICCWKGTEMSGALLQRRQRPARFLNAMKTVQSPLWSETIKRFSTRLRRITTKRSPMSVGQSAKQPLHCTAISRWLLTIRLCRSFQSRRNGMSKKC